MAKSVNKNKCKNEVIDLLWMQWLNVYIKKILKTLLSIFPNIFFIYIVIYVTKQYQKYFNFNNIDTVNCQSNWI